VIHSHPSHSAWFHYPNNIWWRVQIMELSIMKLFSASCHFTPVRWIYLIQHPVLEHPQSMMFPECKLPRFKPIQSTKT
jgi:hypothetical protein